MPSIASEILQGLEEALAYTKGDANTEEYIVHTPAESKEDS